MTDKIEWGGTPGPWVYREWECDPRVNEDGNRYWGIGPKKFAGGSLYLEASGWMLESNARAIAEVLAMVQALRELTQYEGHMVWCGHGKDDAKPCVCGLLKKQDNARAILARIDGEQS